MAVHGFHPDLWKSRSLLPTDPKLVISGSGDLPAELVENDSCFSLFDLIRLFEDLERQAGMLAEARRQPPLEVSPEEVTTKEMMTREALRRVISPPSLIQSILAYDPELFGNSTDLLKC